MKMTAREKIANGNCYFTQKLKRLTDFGAYQMIGSTTQEPEYVISLWEGGRIETIGHYKEDQLVLLESGQRDDDEGDSQLGPPYKTLTKKKGAADSGASNADDGYSTAAAAVASDVRAVNCARCLNGEDVAQAAAMCHRNPIFMGGESIFSNIDETTLLPRWHYETYYMTVLITLAGCGVLVAVSTTVYIMCKVCSDVLEGSQSFSLLLLLAICLVFSSVLPYSFYPDELICQLRLYAPCLAYSAVFATLLSRSIMLATADLDGLPGKLPAHSSFSDIAKVCLFFSPQVTSLD